MIITNPVLQALRTGFRRDFQTAYSAMMATTFYRDVAMVVPSSTKSNTYGWLGEFPGLREWIGARVVRDMKEDAYQIVNKLWEGTIGVQRTDIEDDNLGIYAPMATGLGGSAARHPDELIAQLMVDAIATLGYDGQNFFDTDHPIYPNADGTGVAATVSNYDDGGGTVGPAPWYLMDLRSSFKPFIFQERMKPELDAVTDPSSGGVVFTNDQYQYGARARHNVGLGFWQLAYRSDAPLNAEYFRAARAAMRQVTADGGRPLGIRPSHIAFGPANQSAAERLFKNQLAANGETNDLYDAVQLLDIDWLD